MTSRLGIKGHIRLQVHEAGSGLLVAEHEADNVVCTAGANWLVQAILWSCLEDVNASLGSPFAATYAAPVYGAVGASASGTFMLGTAVNSGTGYLSVTATSPVSLPAGSYLTLGFGTLTIQTVEVPSAVSSATIPTDAFTATATFAANSLVGYVTPADTALGVEVARSTVIGGGVSSSPATWTLTFFMGTTASAWSITEFGVFLNATAGVGVGNLLDHALVPLTVKSPSQTLTSQVVFSLAGS